MPKPDQRELAFIADALIAKVWQGDEAKRGLAVQCASVALAGIQDFTATLYMESADKFTGEDLMRAWVNQSQGAAPTPAPDEAVSVDAPRAWQRGYAALPPIVHRPAPDEYLDLCPKTCTPGCPEAIAREIEEGLVGRSVCAWTRAEAAAIARERQCGEGGWTCS